jgi:hypothetical protein
MKHLLTRGIVLSTLILLTSEIRPEQRYGNTETQARVTWPQEYLLEIPKPLVQMPEGKAYLANVVQNLIGDELTLQTKAVTRNKVSPLSVEYSVQWDHESLPENEREALLARYPKPAVLPLKIVRVTGGSTDRFLCSGLKNDRYTLLTRLEGSANQIMLGVLLCQGDVIIHEHATAADEQELVAAVTRSLNPIRAKLTGDQYATLSISTTPSRASIYLDEQFLGKTPLHYSYLIPGKYRITIKKDGFETATLPIEPVTGDILNRTIGLTESQGGGRIDITTAPAGAKIYLDADFKGLTPRVLENVTLGTYRLHLLHPQSGEVYKTVNLTDAQPALQINEQLTEFLKDKKSGFLGLTYKTWYYVSLISAAGCLGTAIGFFVWRDEAQEDIFRRLSGVSATQYTQADYDFIADRNSAYNTRNSFATGFTVGAGFLAALSIYFYVQHLLSADEGIVMKKPEDDTGTVTIGIGASPGATGVSANFHF